VSQSAKIALLFIGLPYTGKTTLIQCLQRELPGEAIYADDIFTRCVPPSEISLNRWLEEGPHLVECICSIIRNSDETRFYVELGIMRARHRSNLVRWAEAEGYRVIPLWLRCDNWQELGKRHRARVQEIGEGGRSGAKIDITLDDLYRRIRAAFEEPTTGEGFWVINTERQIGENVSAIRQLVRSVGSRFDCSYETWAYNPRANE
jgi:DNA polymerase III delta prime subunit